MGGFSALTLVTFLAGCSLILLVGMLFTGRDHRLQGRLQTLAGGGRPAQPPEGIARFTSSWLPKIGGPLLPSGEQAQSRLRARLIHAGFYGRNALPIFLGAKMLLILLPISASLGLSLAGFMPLLKGALYGLLGSGFGMLLPGMWLDKKKKKRQILLRRSLPDALDMVVVCLRGGLSLQGALQRVTGELALAHPALAAEFTINQREIQLGRSTGEAMRHFAERSDLEEIRGLASVILQAEKLGASAVQALRIHAEALRVKRLQYAE